MSPGFSFALAVCAPWGQIVPWFQEMIALSITLRWVTSSAQHLPHDTGQRVRRAWILFSHDVIWFPAPGTRHQNTTQTKKNLSLQAWGGLRVLGEWDEPDAQETHPQGLSSETHSPARAFQWRSQRGGRRLPLQ